jgi:DNA-binding transcriptional LysR family regulator
MIDWDDIQYFLAVARHGSTLAAGRALNVNQSTVHRRLTELERRTGCRLVERHPTGYRLTDLGHEMVTHADRIEQSVQLFEQRLVEFKRDVVGIVRVTCPEPLVYLLTQSSLLDRFHTRYPGLRVQFVMSDKYLDLAKGDADVALRSGDTDDNELVGRKVADSIWAVHASRGYVEAHGKPERIEDLERHPLVGFDETMTNHRTAKWLREVAPNARVVARNNSVLGMLYAVKSGVGVGPLPAVLGDADEALVRVLGPIPELARIWRVLAHPNLRHTPRVSAFFDFITGETETLRSILT